MLFQDSFSAYVELGYNIVNITARFKRNSYIITYC